MFDSAILHKPWVQPTSVNSSKVQDERLELYDGLLCPLSLLITLCLDTVRFSAGQVEESGGTARRWFRQKLVHYIDGSHRLASNALAA